MDEPLIILNDVGVRYRVPRERIPSFKDFVIRSMKGDVSYQEFWALKNIQMQVNRGEVLGIIGPNGAGKSTLLKVIARVLRPTKGRVRINGRVAPLLELGAGFDHELTGRENIYLNGTILGYSKQDIDRRFAGIVEFADLVDFIDAPLRTYSTGMVARLGFSVATDVRPEILIIDEILGVGDAEFQTKSFERIQSFQAEGTTILLVSHSLNKIEDMCTRALWLDHGHEVASGPTKSIINHYLRQVFGIGEEQKKQSAKVLSEHRWGSLKIEIKQVQIKDSYGVEHSIFQTGDSVTVELDYIAHQPIQAPIFGLAVHRQDGFHITGPNTDMANLAIPYVSGPGKITYKIPYMPLLDGLYHLSVAVVDQNDSEIFDYHDRLYPFRVTNIGEGFKEKYGALTFRGTWTHEHEESGNAK